MRAWAHGAPVGLTVLSLLALATVARGQVVEDVCDQGLLELLDGPTAYQARDGRCEGLYAQQVNSAWLQVRSFLAFYEGFDLGDPNDLLVTWDPPPSSSGPVRLRASSLRRSLYYRMDAQAPLTGSFEWPLDVLEGLDVAPRDVGLIGWVDVEEAAGSSPLYLPLRVHQGAAMSAASRYRLVVIPNYEVVELFVELRRVEAGDAGETVWRRPVDDLGYAAQEPIEIDLQVPGRPGFYRVEIAARLEGNDPHGQGTSGTDSVLFYYGGESKAIAPMETE